MALDQDTDIAYLTLIPGTYSFPKDSKMIEQYINSTKYVWFGSSIYLFSENVCSEPSD